MKRTFQEYLRTYLIIFGMSLVAFVVRWISGQFSDELNLLLFITSIVLITISWEFFRWVNYSLDDYLPYEKSIPKRIAVQIGIGVIASLIIRFLIYEFGEPYLPIQLDRLFLASTWVLYVLTGSVINTIFITRYFIKRWKESIVLAERLEKEKSQVQFDNLKNQLNPHFLFNALTSLNSLIFENQELASKFLQHLSKVYRYVLQNKDKNFVSLGTELEFIHNYVFLAETRFGKALNVQVSIDEQHRDRAIVPVTLQTLVENALKHNIAEVSRPLMIKVYVEDDYIVVKNNLQKKAIVETSNKMGLDNLKSLYHYLTEKPLIIESLPQEFKVKIPLI